jgi:3-hydroxyacyl-CoA dehydrogenase
MAKVAVIGTGFIGQGWAIVFARARHDVALYDRAANVLDLAFDNINRSLEALERDGFIADAAAIAGRIKSSPQLEAAVADADYVQESIPEQPELKRELFIELDRLAAPQTLLASSSSSLPPSRFLSDVPGRARCIIAHPFNPPHIMPIVEIVRAPWTPDDVAERCRVFLEACGQSPVVLNREIFGFAFNRLQTALVNEAIHLVQEGYISPEDIDRCVRDGLGLRWAFMGPFETMDLNAPGGFADYAEKFGGGYQAVGRDLKVAEPWRPETIARIDAWRRQQCPARAMNDRLRWRDSMIMKLKQLKA